MNTEITKTESTLPQINAIQAIDQAVERGLLSASQAGHFGRAFAVSQALNELKTLITPEIMKDIAALGGTSLGFQWDKPYPSHIIKDAVIEALLSGLLPVGRQFCILGGNVYTTKQGLEHKLKNIDGLKYSIKLKECLQNAETKTALCKMVIMWELDGIKAKDEQEFPIRINTGMQDSAIYGKAERAAMAWLARVVLGSSFLPSMDEDDLKNTKFEKDITPRKTVYELLEKQLEIDSKPSDEIPY